MLNFIEHHQISLGIIIGGLCVGIGAILGLRAAIKNAIGRGLNL